MSIGPTARTNINFGINVPPGGGTGAINLPIPDHSFQLDQISLVMARIAVYMVAIAEAVQLISDPKGGVKIKDALDPYQYEVITKALEANDLPIPPQPPTDDITFNPIGGTIIGIADLAGLANSALQLANFPLTQKFFEPVSPVGIVSTAIGAFPDYVSGFTTIFASLNIISDCLSVISTSVNKSVDIPSRALVLKGVLTNFQIALTEQASEIANRRPPRPPDI